MSKRIIGTLVGGLILFLWQFLSWSMLNVHGSQMAYTEKQDMLLEVLEASGLEQGYYFIPRQKPGATAEELQALQEKMQGKPWARVSYHKSFNYNMPLNMIRGLLLDFVAAFFLVWILMKLSDLSFTNILMTTLGIGLIGYLTISYLNTVWFEEGSLPDLVDAVVQWGLCGAWLGWWLPRGSE